THKAAAAGAGASLDPALFVPVLGVGALAFGAGALVLIALIVAGRAARVAAAATAVTLLATLPCVALGLEAVAATRSVKPIALELARRAGPADVVVHEGPIENSGALEFYSGRRPVILDGRRSVLGIGATFPDASDTFWDAERFRREWLSGSRRLLLVTPRSPSQSVAASLPPESVRLLSSQNGRRLYDNTARRGASPPFRTSPQEPVAPAKPALESVDSCRGSVLRQAPASSATNAS